MTAPHTQAARSEHSHYYFNMSERLNEKNELRGVKSLKLKARSLCGGKNKEGMRTVFQFLYFSSYGETHSRLSGVSQSCLSDLC